MERKKLGNSDINITRIGFGAWAIGGNGWEFGWGKQDDQKSIEAILKALENGVNWIDTAAVYGLGHSEEIVAEALKLWKGEKPYVFTKCGLVGDKSGKVHKVLKNDSIRKECEASLKRLKTDSIDLYQIHWPSDHNEKDNEEAWAAMSELKKEGKVRWIGVSNFNVSQMEKIKKIDKITSLQPPFSLVNQAAEENILPYCLREGIGVIVYSPMGSGILTGAMTKERAHRLPDDDWRKGSPDFNEPKLSQNLALVERLREIGRQYSASPGEIAVAWTLTNPAVTAAIVGARSADQVVGIINAYKIKLTDNDMHEIEDSSTN